MFSLSIFEYKRQNFDNTIHLHFNDIINKDKSFARYIYIISFLIIVLSVKKTSNSKFQLSVYNIHFAVGVGFRNSTDTTAIFIAIFISKYITSCFYSHLKLRSIRYIEM